jgi:hypothetical protein
MFKGISAFAGTNPRFPYKRFLRQFPEGKYPKALALMPFTFGWNKKLIESFLLTEGKKLLEFHFGNGSGRRKDLLQPYEFLSGYSVQKLSDKLEIKSLGLLNDIEIASIRFANWYKEILGTGKSELLICPECEDNLSDVNFKTLANKIATTLRKEGLKFEIVRSPCTAGNHPADYLEKHGAQLCGSGDRYIHNMDGLGVRTSTTNFPEVISATTTKALYTNAKNRKCKAFFIWYSEHQGLEGKWLPPRKRAFKCTKEHIDLTRSIFS